MLAFLGFYYKIKEFEKTKPLLILRKHKRNYYLISLLYIVGLVLSTIIIIDLELEIMNGLNSGKEYSVMETILPFSSQITGDFSKIIYYIKFISGFLTGIIVMVPLIIAGADSGNAIGYLIMCPMIIAISGSFGMVGLIVGPFPPVLVLNYFIKEKIETEYYLRKHRMNY